jgi:hypothetical protein
MKLADNLINSAKNSLVRLQNYQLPSQLLNGPLSSLITTIQNDVKNIRG